MMFAPTALLPISVSVNKKKVYMFFFHDRVEIIIIYLFIYRVQSAGIISPTPSHSPPKEGTAMYSHYDHYGLYQHVLL